MKTKILFTIAAASLAAVCNGTPGAAGGTVVGPVGTPTSQTPQPITSQTPGLTLPPIQPNVNANLNMPNNMSGNGNVNENGNFNNRFANTNSLYSITNPPGQFNNQSFGNPPGGGAVMPLQPGINSQIPNQQRLPAGNTLPTANTPLPATVAPSPGANTSPSIIPSAGANSVPTLVPAPSPGVNNNNNSTPPNP